MNDQIFTRKAEIKTDAISPEERTIKVSFSSETPVARRNGYGEPWIETLGHGDGEVDLSRLNASAPVLYNHERKESQSRIGVVEKAWVENGKGYANLRISKRDEVSGIWQDISDGILRNVSVAYQISDKTLIERRTDEPDLYRVSWTPIEISLVDIPADHTVGIGRNLESKIISTTQQEHKMLNENSSTIQDTNSIQRATLEKEKKRRDDIRTLFRVFGNGKGIDDLLFRCLDDFNITESEAKDLLLSHLGKNLEPRASEPYIKAGDSEAEKFSRYAEEAIAFRAGLSTAKPTELCGYSLLEIARKSLEIKGISTKELDKRELIGRSFTHSSSDFPILLANNANKSMMKGYLETEEVFDRFTSVSNLSDFKIHDRVNMSEFGDLEEVYEGGEYKYGSIGEYKEQIRLLTYGKKFSITRQAIINDDLSVFTEVPRKMGRAARRKIGDLVFSILTGNPTMADGLTLFHASHGNIATKGSQLSAASIGSARTSMRLQKDGSGKAVLNIRPSILLAPAALEDTAHLIINSETDPSQSNSRVPNPIRNSLEIITDARLDSHSTTAWYLAANPSQFDTIEIGYLDGNSSPFLEQQEGWDVDGVEFKVRIDAAAKALEWRTLYKNNGI